mmetsp:Transcript_7932/g.14430  ORF Transcript_7932/g.14430 Transcript_7932/m.14430 type:complete len:124 (+) Transcript_7932:32-403(+)
MANDNGKKKDRAAANNGNKKKYVKKRPVPHLNDLLVNGSEESRGQKQTWKQLFVGPAILALVFFLSFLLFMRVFPYIPKTQNYQLPQRNPHQPKVSPIKTQKEHHESPQEEPKEEKVINLAEF